MVKLICAGLIILGGTHIAVGEVRILGLRVRLLRQINESLYFIKSEIAFTLAPIPAIFRALEEKSGVLVRDFYADCHSDIKCGAELSALWEKRLNERFGETLRADELEGLEEVGRILGRSDAETQANAIDTIRERMSAYIASAENDRSRLGRIYGSLGFCISSAIVIVLI